MKDIAIGKAAAILGCHQNTLRGYERRGLISPKRTIFGHRRYGQADIKKLRRIIEARWGKAGRRAVEVDNDE